MVKEKNPRFSAPSCRLNFLKNSDILFLPSKSFKNFAKNSENSLKCISGNIAAELNFFLKFCIFNPICIEMHTKR